MPCVVVGELICNNCARATTAGRKDRAWVNLEFIFIGHDAVLCVCFIPRDPVAAPACEGAPQEPAAVPVRHDYPTGAQTVPLRVARICGVDFRFLGRLELISNNYSIGLDLACLQTQISSSEINHR
jgi:hypothetical protein